jgi:ubiquitin carboxyl-terminal hydrolase 34
MWITAVVSAIEEMAVEVPEELPSGRSAFYFVSTLASNPRPPESDVPSPEEWDDGSMIASDSEMGMAGTP